MASLSEDASYPTLEDALIRWEHEGKIAAQTFPSRGQEAIAIGCCLALEKGDAVIPSFRTRGAMIGMGVGIAEQLREFVHSPLADGDSRDAPHHSSWPELGVMPGSTMIGGHLAMSAGLALAMQSEKQSSVSVAFFGDGTLGSGDLHETMHIAGAWGLPLILVCENNGWEMSTTWSKVRKTRSLIPYAEPFGFAARTVDGNDALDVYHSARWARATALAGQPVFLDCITFRTGLYSSHFGEVRARHRSGSRRSRTPRSAEAHGRLVDGEQFGISGRSGTAAARGRREIGRNIRHRSCRS